MKALIQLLVLSAMISISLGFRSSTRHPVMKRPLTMRSGDEAADAKPSELIASTQVIRTAKTGILPATSIWMATSAPADAADLLGLGDLAIPSAFAAYGHYLGLVLIALSLATERILIKPGMSDDEEEKFANADIVYGLAGVLVLVSGYFRIEYSKGWDFYSHSPIFWVKMLLFTIMGSSSLFPTIKIIQRALGKRNDDEVVEPISEALASRITKILNGEILALCSIPLAASLMSRGVGYANELPWQAGAAPVILAVVGLGVKYAKEAADWEEASGAKY